MPKIARNLDTSRGDALLAVLLRDSASRDTAIGNRLLKEFQSGYPIAKLRLLLRHENETCLETGMWIASELGEAARPFFPEIVKLIGHPSPSLRFSALDCLPTCAGPEDGEAIGKGLDLVDDIHPGVRWKALVFLAKAPESLLRAAQAAAKSYAPTDPRIEGLELLLSAPAPHGPGAIGAALAGADDILRRYAAAAAVRIAHRDTALLMQAMQSEDTAIKHFAEDMDEERRFAAAQ